MIVNVERINMTDVCYILPSSELSEQHWALFGLGGIFSVITGIHFPVKILSLIKDLAFK